MWTWGSTLGLIEKNKFQNANGPADSAGCHIDFNCKDIVVQHNLSKNNAGGLTTLGDGIYVGLATAVSDAEAGSLTEANFGAYSRQQVTAANWTLASSATDAQTVTNAANIEWSASTATDNTITHAFIADAVSGGNILFLGAFGTKKKN